MHVVDAQVEGRADFELRQYAEGRHATGGVHQGGQGAAVNYPGLGVADDLRAVWQHYGEPFGTGAVNAQSKHRTMSQRRQEPCRTLKNGVFGHVDKDSCLVGSEVESQVKVPH
ncbi:hypothetical protein D3C73_1242850 [compost metagenome]